MQISWLEYIYSHGYVHHNIKPANLLMSISEDESCTHVINFGLPNWYWLSSHQSHIPYTGYMAFTGTTHFLSVNRHPGIEQSCRDDLELLAYFLIYFLWGSLPWQGLKVKSSKERYTRTMKKKIVMADMLCTGLPLAFTMFLHYAQNLAFDATSDYLLEVTWLCEQVWQQLDTFKWPQQWKRENVDTSWIWTSNTQFSRLAL